MIQDISVHQLKNILSMDQLQNKILIDVRSPKEHREIKMEGAVNIPLEELAARKAEFENYDTIFVHCRSGGRSQKACAILQNLTKAQEINVKGGILEWEAEGFPVHRGAKVQLTLLRQVHLIAGTLLLVGSALAWFVSPNWILLPAVVGAGLFTSGSTGWCGMAELLSRMPWNK